MTQDSCKRNQYSFHTWVVWIKKNYDNLNTSRSLGCMHQRNCVHCGQRWNQPVTLRGEIFEHWHQTWKRMFFTVAITCFKWFPLISRQAFSFRHEFSVFVGTCNSFLLRMTNSRNFCEDVVHETPLLGHSGSNRKRSVSVKSCSVERQRRALPGKLFL